MRYENGRLPSVPGHLFRCLPSRVLVDGHRQFEVNLERHRSQGAPAAAPDALRERRRPHRREPLLPRPAAHASPPSPRRRRPVRPLEGARGGRALRHALVARPPDGRRPAAIPQGRHQADRPPARVGDRTSCSRPAAWATASLAAGLALAKRLKGEPGRVFCLTSDGEWNEGSSWEALIFAAHHRLDNLTFLVDLNGLQGFGTTEAVADLDPLARQVAARSVSTSTRSTATIRPRSRRRCRPGRSARRDRRPNREGARRLVHGGPDGVALPAADAGAVRPGRSRRSTGHANRLLPTHWCRTPRRPEFVFLTGDLGFMALEPLREAAGERFINAGVAEQNMVSVAAGLARAGLRPWVYSIAPFLYARPFEQIRNDVCLHRLPVVLVGNGGGYGYGVMGATHHALEDYGALLCLPQPARLRAGVRRRRRAPSMTRMDAWAGPAYLRLGRAEKPADLALPPYAPWRRLLAGGGPVMVIVGPAGRRDLARAARLAGARAAGALAPVRAARRPDELARGVPGRPAPAPAPCSSSRSTSRRGARGRCSRTRCFNAAPRRRGSFTAGAAGYPSGSYGSQKFHRRECGLDPAAIARRREGCALMTPDSESTSPQDSQAPGPDPGARRQRLRRRQPDAHVAGASATTSTGRVHHPAWRLDGLPDENVIRSTC